MTTSTSSADPVMEKIVAAVTAHRADGDTRHRDELVALWDEITPGGDPLHRCTLAHYVADMYDDPARALMWDVRALDAADVLDDGRAQSHHAALQVAAFYPSLHLNIADNFRRLGSFDAAAEHVSSARGRVVALDDLGPDQAEYAAMMRLILDEVDAMVVDHSTEARAIGP